MLAMRAFASLALVAACASDPAPVPPGSGGVATGSASASAPAPTPAGPRDFEVTQGGRVVLTMRNEPGMLVDTNAPPPPPGSKLSPHPFLGGSCVGSIPTCSELGEILRASASFDDFVKRLRAKGFEVREKSP
jgi:hypothetical protein